MKFVRVDTGLAIHTWHLYGDDHLPMGLAIQASLTGVQFLGGSPGFDNKVEEAMWATQCVMAAIAVRFMRQGSKVPKDDNLRALAKSHSKPEPEAS